VCVINKHKVVSGTYQRSQLNYLLWKRSEIWETQSKTYPSVILVRLVLGLQMKIQPIKLKMVQHGMTLIALNLGKKFIDLKGKTRKLLQIQSKMSYFANYVNTSIDSMQSVSCHVEPFSV